MWQNWQLCEPCCTGCKMDHGAFTLGNDEDGIVSATPIANVIPVIRTTTDVALGLHFIVLAFRGSAVATKRTSGGRVLNAHDFLRLYDTGTAASGVGQPFSFSTPFTAGYPYPKEPGSGFGSGLELSIGHENAFNIIVLKYAGSGKNGLLFEGSVKKGFSDIFHTDTFAAFAGMPEADIPPDAYINYSIRLLIESDGTPVHEVPLGFVADSFKDRESEETIVPCMSNHTPIQITIKNETFGTGKKVEEVVVFKFVQEFFDHFYGPIGYWKTNDTNECARFVTFSSHVTPLLFNYKEPPPCMFATISGFSEPPEKDCAEEAEAVFEQVKIIRKFRQAVAKLPITELDDEKNEVPEDCQKNLDKLLFDVEPEFEDLSYKMFKFFDCLCPLTPPCETGAQLNDPFSTSLTDDLDPDDPFPFPDPKREQCFPFLEGYDPDFFWFLPISEFCDKEGYTKEEQEDDLKEMLDEIDFIIDSAESCLDILGYQSTEDNPMCEETNGKYRLKLFKSLVFGDTVINSIWTGPGAGYVSNILLSLDSTQLTTFDSAPKGPQDHDLELPERGCGNITAVDRTQINYAATSHFFGSPQGINDFLSIRALKGWATKSSFYSGDFSDLIADNKEINSPENCNASNARLSISKEDSCEQ